MLVSWANVSCEICDITPLDVTPRKCGVCMLFLLGRDKRPRRGPKPSPAALMMVNISSGSCEALLCSNEAMVGSIMRPHLDCWTSKRLDVNIRAELNNGIESSETEVPEFVDAPRLWRRDSPTQAPPKAPPQFISETSHLSLDIENYSVEHRGKVRHALVGSLVQERGLVWCLQRLPLEALK